MFRKIILSFLPILLALSLAGCGSGDDKLIAYQFEGNSVPALDKVMTKETGGRYITSLSSAEGGGEIVETPEEEEEEDDGDSSSSESTKSSKKSSEPEINYISYDYQMFHKDEVTNAIKSYVELLTNEEYQFKPPAEEPDYTASHGSISLTRLAVLLDGSGNPTQKPPSAAEQEAQAKEEGKTDDSEKELTKEEKKAQKQKEKAEKKAQKEKEKAEKKAKKEKEKAEKEAKKKALKNMTKEEKKAAKEKEKEEKKKAKEQAKAEKAAEKQKEKELEVLPPYNSFAHDSTKKLVVQIDWTHTSCLITLTTESVSKTGSQVTSVISFTAAKALMHSIVPAELGLTGDDMVEYNLKPGPGYVMVDDVPCIVMYVYRKTPQYTNELATTCFISADGSTLYQQEDPNDPTVKKVKLGEIPESLPQEGDDLLQMALEADK